jgi:hypothetical protein
MKEAKPRKAYYKHPERHATTISKTIVKTVPRVIYVLDESEVLAAMLRKQDKKK